MKRRFRFITLLLVAIFVIGAACKSKSGQTDTTATSGMPAGIVVKTVKVNNLTATLLSSNGKLKVGDQEVTLAFNDAVGKSVDVGAVSLNFHMPPMGGMGAMNDVVTFTTTDTLGVYRGKVHVSMAGEWQAQLAYEGSAGTGKTTFSVTAQ